VNDVEHDLRELFDRKASSVGGVAPKLPEQVRKRSRRRELGTVLVSGITVLALVVGSVAVLRTIGTGRNDDRIPADDPWAGYEVFERTALLQPFVVTSPSDFYLIDPRRDPRCIPDFGDAPGCDVHEVFQLSNYDPGLASPVCGARIPRGGAVLSVRGVFPNDEGQYLRDPPFPQPIGDEVTDGLCGPGKYAQSQIDGIRIIAWIGVGDGVAADDLTTLERAYDRLEVVPFDREPLVGDVDVASYVIAGGENAAGPWRLDLRPSSGAGPAANVELAVISPEGEGVGAGDFTVPADTPIEQAGGDPTFGAVTKEASGVELRLEEGTPPIPAQVVPLPPSMPFDFDLFFASYDGDVPARAVPIGIPGISTASPRPGGELAELMAVHDRLETALHRLWTELAYIDELDGEVEAAQRDLDVLADEIGPGGPSEEQAARMMAIQDLIVRIEVSMTEHQAMVASLRARTASLREARNVLVEESDPAGFPTMVTVTCTGDRDGGTSLSGPAVLAQEDGVHVEVMNAIPNERVFLDLGTGMAPIEVAGGQRMELVLDEIEPRTLELVCTYETPPGTWRRPAHPLTAMAATS
jgi:hypothetical protein